jgi:hypothetical protein
MTRLHIIPMELKNANKFVSMYHRHHKPVQGHRFSIGCIDGESIVHGVAIVGRPVARKINASTTLEVTRLCTDGTTNACSFLYSAAARIATSLGYAKIQTYILETETGSSLLASGWSFEELIVGHAWKHTDGKPRANDHPLCDKQRWAKILDTYNGAVMHPSTKGGEHR